MSKREQRRALVLTRPMGGELGVTETAGLRGLSERGRASPRRLDETLRYPILELVTSLALLDALAMIVPMVQPPDPHETTGGQAR